MSEQALHVLPYLAGIVDGEGYIGVKRAAHPARVTPGHHARLAVKMNRPAEAVSLLHHTFGGSLRTDRGMLAWEVTNASAERVLRALLPYLLVKRAQAENVLALRALQSESRRHRTKPTGRSRDFPNSHGTVRRIANRVLSDEYIAAADTLWQRGKALNRGGDAQ